MSRLRISTTTRCIHCRLMPELCVCRSVTAETCATRLLLCLHEKETRRVSTSGMLLKLILPQTEFRVVGNRETRADFRDVAESGGGLLLYPTAEAEKLTPAFAATLTTPCTLVIPEGNWNQTRSMVKRVPGLAELTPVSLPEPTTPSIRARRGSHPSQMATLEAVAHALAVLENPELAERVLQLQERAAQGHLAMRGRRMGRTRGKLTSP